MRSFKIIGIVLIVYLGIVVLFESALGYFQPQGDDTLRLSVKGDDGTSLRVLSRIEVDDLLSKGETDSAEQLMKETWWELR